MVPLDTPPLIPNKDTLDLIIGPAGALIILSIYASAASFVCYRLFNQLMTATKAVGSLHSDYSDKLQKLGDAYNEKLMKVIEEQAKRDAEGIVSSRELAASIKGIGRGT